ncbi:FHA domain-containing protein [Arthrobacter cheniae]|uniref:FHA domain-containing protein n=1 Tax=Arthrobacter cheniae TaxID=1258888 RepID=A0A3A5LYQ8_9MICC|nr:FHA domain-containing protein [Arthrobacter cheniae]RJT77746.1 FHA domain-containing protein [Arthrobacter cheniae]
MASTLRLDIDIDFSLGEPAVDGKPEARLSGTVKAAGSTVDVFVDDPASFRGNNLPGIGQVRTIAKALADRGLAVSVSGPKGLLVSIGAVRSSLAQRLITRSPHIRLGSPGTLAPLLGIGRRALEKGDSPSLLPPSTPFPLVPTVNRRIKRTITTTHYLPGGGRPRLIFVQNSESWNGQVPREFELLGERTTIGSGADAMLQLVGLDHLHAEVVHTEDDEYVLVPHGVITGSVNGREESVLRTGARVQLGAWALAFFREEYADHGRPFGGRNGGELSYQRPQRNPRTGRTERDGSTGVGDFRRPPR